MVCVVNQFMGTLNVHGAGFSPNPYLNSLSETLDQMNRQFQQQQYDKVLEDFEESIEESKKEEEEKRDIYYRGIFQ